jgi:hypothetical protein
LPFLTTQNTESHNTLFFAVYDFEIFSLTGEEKIEKFEDTAVNNATCDEWNRP